MNNLKTRAHAVMQMRNNFAIESLAPDRVDIALQQAYVNGATTISQMLQYARQFAIFAKPR